MKELLSKALLALVCLHLATATQAQKEIPQTATIVNDISQYPQGYKPSMNKAPCTTTSCASPRVITPGALGVQVCMPTNCNDADQTAGPDFPGNNCYDLPNPTIWYSIVPPTGTATLQINISSSTTNPTFAVYSTNDCSTFTIYDDVNECYTGSGGSVSGNMSVPSNGTTILIGVSAPAGQTGNFTLCVTPQADASACNLTGSLVESSSSDATTPVGGPYNPGEVVNFCYTIPNYVQTNCNWLQGIVPTFGNCWAASSFNAQGKPLTSTLTFTNTNSMTAPTTSNQAGDFCAGAWAWYPANSVQYNSTSANMPGGWYFSTTGDPDTSWGDGNGMCVGLGMGDCNGSTSGLSWQVCFSLTASTNCSSTPDCSVSFKTYSDGEIGSWTNIGCVADAPDVLSAGIYCCLVVPDAGTDQTICNTSTASLNGSYTGTSGSVSVAWTASSGSLTNSTTLTPAFTPAAGSSGAVTLTMTVTDSQCSRSDQVVINVTAPPTSSFGYSGSPYCSNVTAVQLPSPALTGTGAYINGTYSSTGGLTLNATTGGVTPSSSTPGNYTVTYTAPASGGCGTVTSTASVSLTPLPTATLSYSGPYCTSVTAPQNPTLGGTGAYTGGTYTSGAGLTINSSNGEIIPSTSTPGSYTVTYTVPSSLGCGTVTATASVTITLLPTTSISYAGPYCTSLTSVQNPSSSGTGAYTGGTYSAGAGLSINSSSGGITPSLSTPGTYTVTYVTPSSGGCATVTSTASVTITALPTASISYATPFCTSLTTPQNVNLTGSSGGAYSAGAGLSINSSTGAITPSASTPGTYTVTYTIPAASGCATVTVTASVTITAVPTASISYAGPFCTSTTASQSVNLTGTGLYTGGGYTSAAGLTMDASTGSIIPSTSTPGTYTVTYTIPAGNGCASSTVTASVVINSVPFFTVSGSDPSVCNASDGSFTIAGLDPNTSYTIAYNDDAIPVSPTNILSNGTGEITISGLNAGTYDNISVSFVSTGCANTNITGVGLTNPGAPDVTDIANVTICDATYTLPAISGTALSGSQAYFSGASGSGTMFMPGDIVSTSGTTLLYIYDSNGGCSDQENFTITINTSPTASLSYSDPFCVNDPGVETATLTGTNAYTGGTYSSTAGLSIAAASGTITPSTSAPGTYTVTYSYLASGGCPAGSTTASVIITPLPTAAIDYTDPFCTTDAASQLVNLTGTNAYTGGTFTAPAGLTIDASTGAIIASSSTAGTYAVTYTTPASGGCSAVTATTNVQITQGPTAAFVYSGTPFCSSVSGAQLSNLTGTGAYTGGSYSSSPGLNLNNASGAIDPSLSTAGTYTVTYNIPSSGGCPAATVTATVTITALPTASIDYTDPFCSSDASAQLVNLTGTNAYTGGTFSGPVGLTLNSVSGSVNASTSLAGSYTVTYSTPASGGCAAVNASTNVTVTQAPSATISYNSPYCESFIGTDAVALSGSGAFAGGAFSSSSGLTINASSGTIQPSSSTPGVYTVSYTISPSAGCPSSTATATVTINATPVFTLTSTDPTVCNGSDGTIIISGLQPSSSHSIGYDDDGLAVATATYTSSSSGSITITGLNAGVYDNFILTLNGCSGSNSTSLTLINPGAPQINDLSNQNACETFILPAITGTLLTGSESYWTQTGGTGTQLSPGAIITSTQTIYIFDQNGTCSDEESFVVNVFQTPSINDPGDQDACDFYALGTITGSNLSGNEAFYDDAQANGAVVITGAITSSQTVWIYDYNNACENEVSFVVTINPSPTVTAVNGGGTYCNDGSVPIADIFVDATGTGPFTVNYTLDGVPQIANGTATPIVLDNVAGVYVVTGITDANCSNGATGSQTIAINPIPSAPLAGSDSTYCSNWTLVPMTATGTGSFTWYADASLTDQLAVGGNFTPTSTVGTTTYFVTETISGCEGPATSITITIEDCEIVIPSAFTPNGDNMNDVWQIVDLDQVYPSSVVYVYNRWGNLVYESQKGDYLNKPWDGNFNGDKLPVASYYYLIDLSDEDDKVIKGTVSIIRK
jgi:gliding motility-associated-like protein